MVLERFKILGARGTFTFTFFFDHTMNTGKLKTHSQNAMSNLETFVKSLGGELLFSPDEWVSYGCDIADCDALEDEKGIDIDLLLRIATEKGITSSQLLKEMSDVYIERYVASAAGRMAA